MAENISKANQRQSGSSHRKTKYQSYKNSAQREFNKMRRILDNNSPDELIQFVEKKNCANLFRRLKRTKPVRFAQAVGTSRKFAEYIKMWT
ncbi:MAG: hypothetical protein HYW78_03755 [Parcubacteria group bacterium]|nr:hypothetical protein [Parcubacteria group bacterium]